MTNLEYIRSLSAEELAEMLWDFSGYEKAMFNTKWGCLEVCCEGDVKRWLKLEKQIKIKDCPFCGSIAILKKMAVGEGFYVECGNQIQCGNRTRGQKTEEEAVEKWNRRK